MPEPLVITVMNRFKADLMRREAAQMRSMARRWRQTEAALLDQAELFALRVKENGLTASQLRDARFMLDRSQSLLRQARRDLAKYVDYAGPLIETGQRQAAAGGIQSANAAINAIASEAGVNIEFNRLPVAAVENMVGLAGDNSPLTTLLESSYGAGVDGMFTELIRATALGKNPRETAARMVREGYSQSLTRMMVIARTEQLRVYREAARQAYQESGVVESFRRLATRDSRACAACLMADGEEYELNQTLREHPQGRCTIIPTVTGFPPVQWEKGPDWFVKQSPETQAVILGRGKYAAWRDGKFDLDQLVSVRTNATWGDSLQPTPLRDLVGGERRPAPVIPPIAIRQAPPVQPPAPTIDRNDPAQVRRQIVTDAEKFTPRLRPLESDVQNATMAFKAAKKERNIAQRLLRENKENAELSSILDMRKNELNQAMTALENAIARRDALLAERNSELQKLLHVDNPASVQTQTADQSADAQARWRAGADGFNRLVDARVAPRVAIELVAKADIRAYYNPQDKKIYLQSKDDGWIVAHELGHWLEDANPSVHQKALDFFDRRTSGEARAQLTGMSAFETGKRDRFIDPYMGREYVYNGDRYATEIVSMGIQYFYKDAHTLATQDPDYFDFIFNLLRGR